MNSLDIIIIAIICLVGFRGFHRGLIKEAVSLCSVFVGLFMASGARDGGILGFGLALSLFAVLFCWWMIKIAFDEAEQSPDSN